MFRFTNPFPLTVQDRLTRWSFGEGKRSQPTRRQTIAAASKSAPTSKLTFKLNSPATGFTILVWALMISLVSLTVPPAAYAQVLYGSLTGNVVDQAGAVVAGGKVEA